MRRKEFVKKRTINENRNFNKLSRKKNKKRKCFRTQNLSKGISQRKMLFIIRRIRFKTQWML
jgi:hypothetical protein